MSATPDKPSKTDSPVVTAPQPGPVSQWLTQQGFEHDVLEPDHLDIEQIGVESLFLPVIAAALKSHGFDYLQCQGGCLLYTSPSPRDLSTSRMPSSA